MRTIRAYIVTSMLILAAGIAFALPERKSSLLRDGHYLGYEVG